MVAATLPPTPSAIAVSLSSRFVPMSASGGKRSVRSVANNYTGLSATEFVTSALPPPRLGSGGAAPSYWPPTDVDYNLPWFEKRGDDYYCNLCCAFATEGHVASEKHIKRALAPEY